METANSTAFSEQENYSKSQSQLHSNYLKEIDRSLQNTVFGQVTNVHYQKRENSFLYTVNNSYIILCIYNVQHWQALNHIIQVHYTEKTN